MGPTFSVSGISLSDRMVSVWHRGKAKANRLLGNVNTPPETRTAHESTCRIPFEIVEMIIAPLTSDCKTLKACSLTCRSWYIVAAPHLYHTLSLGQKVPGKNHGELKPLYGLYGGRVPLVVKEIRVWQPRDTRIWFVPLRLSRRDLRCWSAFANVQTLTLQRMQIFRFIPGIERYFKHFSPTLRSITLIEPCCTPRQLSYFLSLFSNLDDIAIELPSHSPNTTIPDTELVPFSAPKLRGQLMLYQFSWVETWTHLIALCGGLRFRYMDLHWVEDCAPILLEACAETLETLRFYMTDSNCPVEINSLSLVSRLKVLRSLQVGDWAGVPTPGDTRHTTVMKVFSTITSPVFFELVVVLGGDDIAHLPSDVMWFEALRVMNEIRPFKLVILFELCFPPPGEGRQELMEVFRFVIAKGFLDFLDSPPTVRWARRDPQRWGASFPDSD